MSSARPVGRAAGDRCEGWREAAWCSRAKCLPTPSLGVLRRVALSIATPRRELSDAGRDLCPASRRHAWQHPRELERAVRQQVYLLTCPHPQREPVHTSHGTLPIMTSAEQVEVLCTRGMTRRCSVHMHVHVQPPPLSDSTSYEAHCGRLQYYWS